MPGALEPGSSISHYRIISAIGSGGMGEVYKAHDTNLDRPVALKILPPELVRNDDRVRRFVQEAKSASSLNHPHIVTIHEIGTSDSIYFIAMELIDGLTLKSRIQDTDLKTLLVYLSQAAEGLAKAHAAGIVHRDLKPENIMITRDGYAKVLDFGLAKLSIRIGSEGTTRAPTEAREQTREGAVLGTVAYMSPEQVQGRVVDHRSDIFSFGCILYEVATKRRAFDADSDIDLMHKIVHDKPAPVDELNPSVPAELRRMIRRCLAKEPDRRYQSMKDVAIELADMVEEFDQLSASTSSASVSISSPAVTPIRQPITIAVVVVAAAALLFAAVIILLKRNAGPPAGPSQSMRMRRVTNGGNVIWAFISPDGRYLAHMIRDEAGMSTLLVRQISTSSDVKVVGPSPSVARPSFSPDGDYLFYSQYPPSLAGAATLYRVPTLGGESRKVSYNVDTAVTLSPDGSLMAYGRGVIAAAENHFLVARSDGSNERIVAKHLRRAHISHLRRTLVATPRSAYTHKHSLQKGVRAGWQCGAKRSSSSLMSEGAARGRRVSVAGSIGRRTASRLTYVFF